jgi:hypothetical protein
LGIAVEVAVPAEGRSQTAMSFSADDRRLAIDIRIEHMRLENLSLLEERNALASVARQPDELLAQIF